MPLHNTTINQTTQNMAIDWQSYNVKVDERVQYIQPNSSSVSLNRILSNNGSTIAGRIDANGQVILVNPNGVFFTPASVINVGGIIASGLDIQPTDFMNGNYIFNEVLGTEGTVINSGTINASLGGNIALLGKQVANDGLIVANLGTVSMAAGKQAVLTFDQGGLLGVRISKEILQDELGVDPAVVNSGEIKAEGGRVLLTASVSQDIFSQAVNTTGLDQATSVVVHEDGSFTLGGGADVINTGSIDTSTSTSDQNVGRIVLLGENVTSNGELRADAASGNGGEIELHARDKALLTENSVTFARADADGVGGIVKVLGDKVGVFDQSMVDVSGVNGGGQALIGGDFQGKNKNVRNATTTIVSSHSKILADAVDSGDGGKVIVWAEDATRFYGHISARGGNQNGNGGFAEVSGKERLAFHGVADLTADSGHLGTLLLDPQYIRINNNPTAQNFPNDYNSFGDGGNTSDYDLNAGDLSTQLNSANIRLQANTDIIFSADVTATTQSNGGLGNLQVHAGRSIFLEAGVDITLLGGNFEAIINHGSAESGNRVAGNAVFNMETNSVAGDSSIITNGGNISISTGTFTGNNIGDITLRTLNASTPGPVNSSVAPGGDITVTNSTGNIDAYGSISATGENPANLTGGDGGTILLTANTGTFTLHSSGSISSNGGNAGTGGSGNNNGGNGGIVTVSANNIDIFGNITSNGGDRAGNSTNGSGGTITLGVNNSLTIEGNISSVKGTNGASGTNGNIILNGDGSANIFNINNAVTFAASSVTVNGLGGSDRLVRGGTTATNNTWTVFDFDAGGAAADGANDGQLVFNGNTINFVDVESLIGGSLDDQFVLTVGGSLSGLIDGNLSATGDSLQINTANTNVELGNRTTANINVHRMEAVTAGAGINTLIGDNTANTWTLGTTNSVSDGTTTTTFSNFTTATGGSGVDIYNATAGSGITTINGGAGDDNITLANAGEIANVNGDAGSDSLTISNGNNTWKLIDIANNNGSVEVTGSPAIITDFQSVETHIASSGGNDKIDLSGVPLVRLANYQNFGIILGDNTGTLQGMDGLQNDWSIRQVNDGITLTDGVNDGIVTVGSANTRFINFLNLTGGNATDNFSIADTGTLTGLINGGGGANSLAGANVSNTWTMTNNNIGNILYTRTGDLGATQTNFIDIQTLNGGNGDDTFNFDVTPSVANVTINGGGQVLQDSVNLSSFAGPITVQLGASGFNGIELITGNNTNSTLIGADAGDTWNITGQNDGNVAGTSFINFNNLTGGSGNDIFNLGASVTGLINGGAGNDTLAITAAGNKNIELGNRSNANLNVFQMETITANATVVNVLIGDSNSATNNWNVNGARNGTVSDGTVTTTFNNINHITGGSTIDNFNLAVANFAGLIDGGAGNDSLQITAIGDQVIELGDRVNTNQNVFQIEAIAANASAINTLIGDSNAGINSWTISGSRSGSVGDGATTTAFTNINNVTGGATTDDFTLSTGNFAGLINGGAGSDSLLMTVAGDRVIELGDRVTGNVNIYQMETVQANATSTSTLIADNTANTWNINGANRGTVSDGTTATAFFDFVNLTGGSQSDTFNLITGGSVAGVVNGSAGNDSVTITAAGDRVVELGNRITDNLNIFQVELITANATANNTLIGDNVASTWNINGINRGTVANTTITTAFSNFATLTGGTDIDTVTIATIGRLGTLNGGLGNDVITLSGSVTTINADEGNDFVTVSGGDADRINLGDGDDQFTFNGGMVTTGVYGEAGNDNFTVVGNNITGVALYDGGADTDTIGYDTATTITVGSGFGIGDADIERMEGVSAVNGTLNARQQDVTTTWTINGVNQGTVYDSTDTTQILAFDGFSTLNGYTGIDNFNVTSNGSVTGLISSGGGGDTLTISLPSTRTQSGQINFDGGAGTNIVTMNGDAGIYTETYNPSRTIGLLGVFDQLAFDNGSGVSFAANYRQVAAVNDDIQVSNLTINSANNNDVLRLGTNLFGAASASTDVNYAANSKTNITMLAQGGSDVEIVSNVTLNGILALSADEVREIGGATMTADGLTLDGVRLAGTGTASNERLNIDVNDLRVNNHTGSIFINEQTALTLAQMTNTTGLVDITAANLIDGNAVLSSSGALNLISVNDSINLSAQNHQLSGPLSLSAANDVRLNNVLATNLAGVLASNFILNSTGNITDSGVLNVTGTSTFSSGGDITLDAANDFGTVAVLNGNNVFINDVDDLNVDNRDVNNGMTLGNVLTGTFRVTSRGMGVGYIHASNINLDAGSGAITAIDNSDLLIANDVTLRASTGIGTGSINYAADSGFSLNNSNAINTQTASLSAINTTSGALNIDNNQAITLQDLRNRGDIILNNLGDITLAVGPIPSGSNTTVIAGAIDANYGGNILDAPYAGSVAILGPGTGNVRTQGVGFGEADITAENLLVSSVLSFGTQIQPIRLRVNNQFTLFASSGAVSYFGAKPANVTTSSDLALLVVEGMGSLSGQQLIDIESLGDVDQAIFTEVRNYNYDEIAIKLPADQRYTDEDDDEKKKSRTSVE